MSLELISFDLCPFVQRSVITLLEKKIDFKISYIDLKKPPKWFLDVSPFGKVPVLIAENQVVFESAVINEYVDEVTPPGLMPQKPITKAINRAWIEFASKLLAQQYQMSVADNEQVFDEIESRLLVNLQKLENKLGDSKYFNGDRISLVDTAFAPLLLRFEILLKHVSSDILDDTPKIKKWSKHLLALDSVTNSIPENFEIKYISYIRDTSQYMAEKLGK